VGVFIDMWNNVSKEANRRILIALVVSVLLHLVFLMKQGLSSSTVSVRASTILNVKLSDQLTEGALSSQPQQLASVRETFQPLKEIESPKKIEKLTPITPAPLTQSEHKPVESLPANPVLNKPTNSPPLEPSSGVLQSGSRTAPTEVVIEFQFSSGSEKIVGVGRHHYVSADGESYGVSVTQKPGSEANISELPWQLDISGRITRQGLSPILFQMRGIVPERLMSLKELPERLPQSVHQARSGRMPDGILDRQSLLYHFMFSPPTPAGGGVLLTDGAGYALYQYRVAEPEVIRIESVGDLRASKLVLTTIDSPEFIELWLIPEMHHLPVKVRHTDRRGIVTEQVAISLNYK
jgi:hypothetical protein